MFDLSDILYGILILGFIVYILIDSYLFEKKMKQRRKETNEQRIKEGRKPFDYDNAPVGGGYCSSGGYSSGDSEAADKFRSDIFRNMGMMG